MLRRTLHGLCFFGAWVLLLVPFFVLSDNTAPVFPEIRIRRELLQSRAEEIEALSFGTSHARALDFGVLGIDGMHFWNASADLHEAAFLIDELVPTVPGLRCVFVALSPYNLVLDNAVMARHYRRRELYARTLSARFISGDLRQFVAGKMAPLVREDHWSGVLMALARAKPSAAVYADGALGPRFTSTMPLDTLVRHATERARRHEAQRRQVLNGHPGAAAAGEAALTNIIERSGMHDAAVVLYTPPYHESYVNALEDGALDGVRDRALSLARKYDHVTYADHSRDPAFRDVPDYFYNSDHMNVQGAREFSRQLKQALRGTEADVCIPGIRSTAVSE